MDLVTYALCKKIAESAVSGISDVNVDGQTLFINTTDGNTFSINFPTPQDGVGIDDIEITGIGETRTVSFTMTNGSVKAIVVPFPKGDKGEKGDQGKSAYEISLENGFVGTEEEWVNSLKGSFSVDTKADLIDENSYKNIYVGMIVFVKSEGQAYILKNPDCTILDNWGTIGISGIINADYTTLENKPTINNVVINGDLSLNDLGLEAISSEDILSMF